MKKRALSLLLSICMVFGLLPVTARAAPEERGSPSERIQISAGFAYDTPEGIKQSLVNVGNNSSVDFDNQKGFVIHTGLGDWATQYSYNGPDLDGKGKAALIVAGDKFRPGGLWNMSLRTMGGTTDAWKGVTSHIGGAVSICVEETEKYRNSNIIYTPIAVSTLVPANTKRTVRYDFRTAAERNSNGAAGYYTELFYLGETYAADPMKNVSFMTGDTNIATDLHSVGKTLQPNGITEGRRAYWDNKSGGSAIYYQPVTYANNSDEDKWVTSYFGYYAGVGRSSSLLSSYHHTLNTAVKISCGSIQDQLIIPLPRAARVGPANSILLGTPYQTIGAAIDAYAKEPDQRMDVLQDVETPAVTLGSGVIELGNHKWTSPSMMLNGKDGKGSITLNGGTLDVKPGEKIERRLSFDGGSESKFKLRNLTVDTTAATNNGVTGVLVNSGTLTIDRDVAIRTETQRDSVGIHVAEGATLKLVDAPVIEATVDIRMAPGSIIEIDADCPVPKTPYVVRETNAYDNWVPIARVPQNRIGSFVDKFVSIHPGQVAEAKDGIIYFRGKKVILEAAGGTLRGEKVRYTMATGRLLLPDPYRAGFTFDGWYTEPEGGEKVTKSTVFEEGQTIYAHWTGAMYTVVFWPGEGTLPEGVSDTKKVQYLGKFGEMPVPIWENHDFVGWFSGSTLITEDTIFTEAYSDENVSLPLKARWKESAAHVISFDSNGGYGIKSSQRYYYQQKPNPTYANLPTPNRAGYTFTGWFTEQDGGTLVKDGDPVTTSRTLYAHWAGNEIDVALNASPGKFDDGQTSKVIKHTVGGTYELPTPTCEGRQFTGWYSGSQRIKDGDTVAATSDHTLTAKWGLKPCYVTFVPKGGTFTDGVTFSKTITAYYEETAVRLAATRPGYTLLGWTKTDGGKDYWNFSTDKVTEDMRLYADWDVLKHGVTLNAGNGTFADGEVSKTQDISSFAQLFEADGTTTKSEYTPTREGYDFAGWYRGSVKVTSATAITGAVSLAAKWTAKEFTLTLELAGGKLTEGEATQSVFYGQKLTRPVAVKTNSTLTGWKKADGTLWNFSSETVTGDLTLTAAWYNGVNLDADGGKFQNEDGTTTNTRPFRTEGQTYAEMFDGDVVKAEYTPMNRDGYTFDGWSTDGTAKNKVTANTSLGSTTTLVPIWNPMEVTVTFDVNGGNPLDTSSKTYHTGETYGTLPAPTKNADTSNKYHFAGWYTEQTDGTRVSSTSTVEWNADGITLYAQWRTSHIHDDMTSSLSAWNATDTLPVSGGHYLTEDVTLSEVHRLTDSTGGVRLCLNGHKIIGSAKGVYELTVKNALKLYDCQGTGEILGNGKGVAISSEGNSDLFSNFEMRGGTIRNFATGVSLPKGTFTMEGGTITGNAQGGVSARRVDMNGGEITGNGSETSEFGGVKVESQQSSSASARFKITGGKLTNNKAGGTANRIAGGVLLKGTALFFMLGGEISGNQAIGTGADTRAVGGVNAYDVDGSDVDGDSPGVRVSGGKITNNEAQGGKKPVGGVLTMGKRTRCRVDIYGTAYIYNNFAYPEQTSTDAAASNLRLGLEDEELYDVTNTKDGAKIGVAFDDEIAGRFSRVFSDSSREALKAAETRFSADIAGQYVTAYFAQGSDHNYLKLVDTPPEDEEESAKPHTHAICGEPTCTEAGHTVQTYEKSGNNYYLNANSNRNYLLVSSGQTYNVCLNGYTLTTIEIKSGGTLNLCDCKGGGKVTTLKNEGTLNLYSGSVTTLTGEGTGTANLYGGDVTRASSSSTGAFLVDGATVNAMSFTGITPIELKSGRVGSVQMNTGWNKNHKIKLTGATVTGTITLTAAGQIDAAGLTGGPYTVAASGSGFPTTEGSTYALTSGWGKNPALADATPAGYFVQDSSNRYITIGTVNGVKEAVVAYTKDPDNPGGETGSETAAHEHCTCGESLIVCKQHDAKAFSQITGTSFNGSAKYLTEDMQNLTVQSGSYNYAYLCLNGHKLGTLTVDGSYSKVYICDCQGGGSVEKVVAKGSDSMVYLRSGSVTTMEVCAAYLYGGTVQDITVANGNSPYLYLEGAAVKGTITLGSGSKIYTDSKFTGGPYTVSLGVLTGEKSAVFTRDWSSSMKDKDPANYFISAVEGYAPAVDSATGEVLMQKQSTGTDPGGNTSGKVVIVLPDGSTVEVDPGTDGKISKEELEDAIRDTPIAPSPGQVLDKDDGGNHKWVDEDGKELTFPVDVPTGEEVVIYPQLKDCEHPNATRENEVEGTCNTQGTVDINCPDCTLVTTENTGFAPHKPGADWKGGDDDNIHWKECTVCGAKADVEDHILVPQDGELQADCVQEGKQEFKCETCGRQGVELTIPALGHDFRIPHDDQNTDTHTFKCTRCDAVDTEREAHDFTANVKITKEPTTEADGILTTYCVCGASKTEPIPKLEIVDVPGSVTEGYEAAFDLNLPRAIDGLTAPGPQKAAAGDSITIPALTGTRLGYQFKGWQSDSDGQIYQAAASFTMPESPVIFSAQWERDRNGTELNPGDKLVLDDGTVIENKGGQPNTVIEVDRDGDGIPEIVITLPNGEDSVIVRPIEVPTDTDGDGENDIVIDKEIIEIPGGTQVEPNITPPGREPDPNNKDSTITVGPDGGTVDLDGEVTGGEGTTSKDKDGNEVTITDGKGTIDPDGDIDLPNGGKVETGEGEEIEIPKRVEDEEPGFVAPGEPPEHETGGGKDDGGGDEKPSTAPVITQQPQSPGTLTEGQIPKDTTLTVGVKEPENGEITYQWYTDDPDDPTKRIPIPGANGPEYQIPADLESGTHHYYCEVTNTEPDKAPTTVQTDEVSVIVKPKDAPGGEKVPLEPGERVEIDTDGDGKPDITVERDEDGDTVTIDKDGDGKPDVIITVPVPPEKGDVTVDKETGEVDVPPGSIIDPGGNKPEIELPDGGKVDPDDGGVTPGPGGSVVIPGGGSGGEDITITPPTDGDDDDRKVTPNPDGTVEVPGGSTIDPGGNKPEIELPDGGKVDPDDGGVTPGPGGSVVIPGGGSGGEDITITPPTDGDDDDRKVTPNPDGTVEVPGGSTVDPGGNGPELELPDGGKVDPDDGGVTPGPGGSVVIPGGGSGGEDITITPPTDGDDDDRKVTPNPDGTVEVPKGSEITTDDITVEIQPDSPGPGVLDPDNGVIKFPDGGTVIIDKGDGPTPPIDIPAGGSVSIGDGKEPSAEPVITKQPQSPGTLTEGRIPEDTSLTVGVKEPEDGEITYQWYTDDPNDPTKRIPIPGANGPEYPIPEDLGPGTHHYYCEVTNTEPGKAPTTVKTDEVSVTVKPKDKPDGEKVPLGPGGQVEVDTDGDGKPDTTVKRDEDGDTVTIDKDGDGKPDVIITVPVPPEEGDVTVDKETGEVDVPPGSTVDPGGNKPEIELPDGGKVDPDDGGVTPGPGGSVVIPGGGSGGEDITITPPTDGDDDDRKVTPNPDGTVEVPGGSTVEPGGNGPKVELPDGGKVDPDDGGVTPGPGGSVVIPGGGSGGEDITITPPTDGDDDDRKVTPNPDGTVEVPKGSEITTDDITVAIQPDSPGPGVLDPDNDVIKFPDGGTVIIDKGDGPTPPIDIPEGGSISIGNDATNIEGTVEDTSGDAVDGADVRIQRGNIIMQRTTTGSDGLFRMYSIPGGKYNLVAEKDGKTVTKLVTLSGQTETVTLHMPSDNVNSILKVVDNTPVSGSGAKINEVVVGGLDEEAEEVRKENDGAESITVTMTVTGKAEHEAEHSQEIKRKAAGQRLEYLEIEVEKNVDGDVSKIDVTKKLLEIVIPFDFTGKENVSVYRYHDGSVDTLAERQNADEEYIEIDKTGGFITLFVRKFSTYAVGYDISEEEPPEEEEPGSPEEERPGRPARPTASSEEDHTPKIEGDEHGTVTIRPERPKPGDNVTITLTPDAGYDSDGVTVTDENGKPIPVIDNGDGTYTFTQPDGRVTIRVRFSAVGSGYDICPKDHTCPIARFDDAVPTEWYHDGVHYCLENGLMVGISENTFRPGQATSRVMIAAILWRLEGSPAVSGGKSTRFADVPDHTWYTDAVEWAASANIVSGYNRNTFGPDDLVTREQLVSMLWRYANYKGYDVSVGENTNILGYQDIAAAGDWAIPALQWAVGSRVSVGKSGNILDPQGFSTRAEAASMLQRFCSMYDV